MALHESPLRLLQAGENPSGPVFDGGEFLREFGLGSDSSADSEGPVIVAVGDEYWSLDSLSALPELEKALVKLESPEGPRVPELRAAAAQLGPQISLAEAFVPDTKWTTGTFRILVVRTEFSDGGEVLDASEGLLVMNNQVNPFIQANSYGATTVLTDISASSYKLPRTKSSYSALVTDNDKSTSFSAQIMTDAKELAAQNHTLSDFDSICVVFPRVENPDWAGLGSIGGGNMWINGFQNFNLRVVSHELGHNLGLRHANLWKVTDGNPYSPVGESEEYGDVFDTMGDQGGEGRHFSPYAKHRLGWLDESRVRTVSDSGQFRIFRFDHENGGLPSQPQVMRIYRGGDLSYWLGVRRAYNDAISSNINESAYLTWGRTASSATQLLDLNTPGENSYDAGLSVGASLEDSLHGIRIEATSEGGASPVEYMDFTVTRTPPPRSILAAWGGVEAPVQTLDVSSVAVGSRHGLALKVDGTVSVWGDDSLGQSTVPPGVADVASIAAGGSVSGAVLMDGTVRLWGDNSRGLLSIPLGLSDVRKLSIGGSHILALRNDGTVLSWGDGANNGDPMPDGLTNIVDVAAGWATSVALTDQGQVVVWGHNYGSVPEGLTNVTAIAAGFYHFVALKSDGSAVVWGNNSYGQTQMPTITERIKSIAAGYNFSVALLEDGSLQIWGQTSQYQEPPSFLPPLDSIAVGSYVSAGVIRGSQTPYVSLDSVWNQIDYQSSQYTLQVESNTEWTVSNTESWITVAPQSGQNSQTLTVSIESNPSLQPRSAEIQIGSTIHRITQTGAPAAISIEPSLRNSPAEGETYPISVVSNTSWTASSNENWATVSPSNGSGNGDVAVEVTTNSLTAERSAIITIGGREHLLSQEAAAEITTITPASYSAAKEGTNYTISVSSNTAWTASSNEGWVMVSPAHGSGNGTVSVTLSANSAVSSRSAEITIGGEKHTLTQVGSGGFAWEARQVPNVTSGTLHDVTYDGQNFYVVGTNGVIFVSQTGENWGGVSSAVFGVLHNIHHDGRMFVAVGESGRVVRSLDGTNWSQQNSNTSQRLLGVASSGQLFVIVGKSGFIASSPDGISWTTRDSGTNQGINDVHWANGQFVAVADIGHILTSSDGITWSSTVSGNPQWHDVTWGNGTWVAAGQWSQVATSSDGLNWTNHGSVSGDYVKGVEWVGNEFIAVGYQGKIIRSEDGVNWTEDESNTSRTFWGITESDSTIVAVGEGMSIVTTGLVSDGGSALVAEYQLDGDLLDTSGNSLHGTGSGIVATSDRFEKSDGAMQWNRGQMTVPHRDLDHVIDSDFTIAVWVKGNSSGLNYPTRLWKKRGWTDSSAVNAIGHRLQMNQNGSVRYTHYVYDPIHTNGAGVAQQALYGSIRVDDGDWHHTAVVRESDTIRLFVDGQLQEEASLPVGVGANQDNLTIGWAGSEGFNITGALDDFRIYRRALSATELMMVKEKPEITTQPQTQTVEENDSITLAVVATSDSPATYQWRKDGNAISGATSFSFEIAQVKLSDGGSYDVVVTNTRGNTISDVAVLTVLESEVDAVSIFDFEGGSEGWTFDSNSEWQIDSQEGVLKNTSTGLSAAFSPFYWVKGVSYELEVDIFWESGPYFEQGPGWAMAPDLEDFYFAIPSSYASNRTFRIYLRDDGQTTVPTETVNNPSPGVWYKFKVTVDENGAHTASYDAAPNTLTGEGIFDEGWVGLIAWANATRSVKYDNFKITITSDSDGDGINDAVENGSLDFGNPRDSDGDGTPDYLDSASNPDNVTVSGVSITQREASSLIDVSYTFSQSTGTTSTVTLEYSRDGGVTWQPADTVSGDVGENVAAGAEKSLVWDAAEDLPAELVSDLLVRLVVDDGLSADGVVVSAGEFNMGSPTSEPGRNADEVLHAVTLTRGFVMGTTEVTWDEWNEVRTWAQTNGYTDLATGAAGHGGGHLGTEPVTFVSWYDSVKWLNAKSERAGLAACYTVNGQVYRTGNSVPVCDFDASGYRLPTEAEWEFACRAGTTTRYSSGPNVSDLARVGWYIANAGGRTHEVALKEANDWGLHDMHGNVSEWVWDRIGAYDLANTVNPTGPATGSVGRSRGGAFVNGTSGTSSASRNLPNGGGGPAVNSVGIRPVRTVGPNGAGEGVHYVFPKFDIDLRRAPTITTQPQSQTVDERDSVTFTVVAASELPVTYQWRKDGVEISDATNSSFEISTAKLTDAGSFDVVVSNTLGSVTSDAAVLTVRETEIGAVSLFDFEGGAPGWTFTGSNGWQVDSESGVLTNNSSGLSAAFSPFYWVKGISYELECDIYWTSGSYFEQGPGWAMSGDLQDFYFAIPSDYGPNRTFRIYERKNGQTVTQTEVANAPSPGVWYRFKITVDETGAHTATYDASSKLLSGQGTIDEGWVGLIAWANATRSVKYDNFKITITSDSDGDGINDAVENGSLDFGNPRDADGDGTPDYLESNLELLSNGGFEEGRAGVFFQVNPGSSDLAPWRVSSGQIDLTSSGPRWTAYEGSRLVDLDGFSPGAIEQDFATVAGELYKVSFQLSGNDADGATVKRVEVSVGSITKEFSYDVTGGHRWEPHHLYFRASSDSSTLGFRSLSSGSSFGPLLDGVGVVPANDAAAPVVQSHPQDKTVSAGQSAVFSVSATGVPAASYQWRKNGVAIPGATGPELDLGAADVSDEGNYDVEVSNIVGSVFSEGAFLTVNVAPSITSQPQAQTVVSGTEVSFAVTATAKPEETYQWRKNGEAIPGATGPELNLGSVDVSDEGNYDVEVRNIVGSIFSEEAFLTVNVAPSITSQPQAQTVVSGTEVTFAVTATAKPEETYQWRKNGVAIPGATGPELNLGSVDVSDEGNYDVEVSNIVGSVFSEGAFLTVNVAPSITSQPQAQTVVSGTEVSFAVTATAKPEETYQWRKNGVAIPGATGPELNLGSVDVSDEGNYDVEVRNIVGSVFSEGAFLTVNVGPSITTQPQAQTVVSGTEVSFAVTATAKPEETYQWRKNGVAIPGATGPELNLGSVDVSDEGNYDVEVSNVVGSVFSEGAFLTVNVAPSITTQPQSRTVVAGGTITLSVEATGVPAPTYQWRKGGADLVGETSAELSIPSSDLSDAGDYDVVVANVVDSVTSTVAKVLVHTAPVIASQSKSQTVLAGEKVTLSVEATGIPDPTYQWRQDGVAIAGATESTFVITSAQAEDAGDYDVVVSNVVDDVTSGTATLTVQSVPEITTQPISQTVVSGESVSFSVEATGLPSPIFQWRKDGIVVVDATDATYTIGVATANDAGAYDVVVSNAAGEVNSNVATLTVNSLPSIVSQPQGVAVLAGASVELNVTADGADPLSYQWRKDGGDISGANAATFSIPSVGLDDAGAYDVRVSNEFGSVISDVATVSVVELMGVHSLAEGGYQAGQTITVNNTITYAGSLGSFGWSVIPPATIDGQAWDFASSGAGAGQVSPLAGDTDLFEWAWTSNPSSPIEFSYTVNVPDNAEGDQELTAILRARIDGQEVQSMVTPDPLVFSPAPSTHSADTDMDSKLSLSELLRVIELYNYREDTRRTGAYQPDDSTADGFAAGPGTGTPSRYHSADFDQSGSLSLSELLRVIELYNYREGTRRTGEYHADGSTVDGFSAGPEVSD
ncbi:MAG: hypothetical protein SynsKO_05900 [Synoicihabitans sp.]